MKSPYQIKDDFVVLNSDKTASIEHFDSNLFSRIDNAYNGFIGCELIACYEFDSDWKNWEVHPHGDEIIILMSGKVTFISDFEDGESAADLTEQGQYIVVPKGVWHTAKTKCKSSLLFITPGQGTQHKSKK